jgi:hypothetical protein
MMILFLQRIRWSIEMNLTIQYWSDKLHRYNKLNIGKAKIRAVSFIG